ncbi:unnamed protein product [Spirodela intermedia]|uniref:Uncharacterized protein n=1 Tax=Spirodela intermedia TaxID=51605 RepID=A0A7I8LED1_SPIIN|nr:unnamed protein product [Spirodela intermedia]
MGLLEASIIHHVGGVLALTWALSWFGCCHPIVYVLCLAYLYMVHEHYITRLRRRLQFEERKHANQRRLLSDAETLRWLNHAVEKVWPMCMEQIASQRFLLPIVPWFLEKYKPWTAKKAVVQHLYLGRSPPAFTDIRVVHPSADDDHLVLELGMNFLSADDMSSVLAVKLRKRLGFGMWAKLHVTGIHVEGRVLIGLKFLRKWPFLGRLRLCFVEPPFFQVTVKPIFSHGLDVTEIPGISGWVDKLLTVAFAETLVEPNMLVVDVEKFVSSPEPDWFTVDEKCRIAYAKVEILEGADMNPSDLNGLADPYVRGRLGSCRFQTKVQRKTLSPRWYEMFKIPITSWEAAVLRLEVRDKDYIFDDSMGICSVNIGELRGGQRHDMWQTLKDVKMGSLHLAITVLEDGTAGATSNKVEQDEVSGGVRGAKEREQQPPEDGGDGPNAVADAASTSAGAGKGDVYEPVDILGQETTGVWVHRPGPGCASRRLELRRGREGLSNTELLQGEAVVWSQSSSLAANTLQQQGEVGSDDDEPDGHKAHHFGKIQRGLRKVGHLLKSPKGGNPHSSAEHPLPTPNPGLRTVTEGGSEPGKGGLGEASSGDVRKGSAVDAPIPGKEKAKGRKEAAICILRQVGNSAQNNLRKVLSAKGPKPDRGKEEVDPEAAPADSSTEEESLTSPGERGFVVDGVPMGAVFPSTRSAADPGSPSANGAAGKPSSPPQPTQADGHRAVSPPAAEGDLSRPPSRKVSFRSAEGV